MNAQSCLGFFVNNTAHVVLMDISLPDTSGVELCAIMKEKYPGIMILGLSTFNQGLYIKKMMENGASGYILKNAAKDELLKAIHAVHDGQYLFQWRSGTGVEGVSAFFQNRNTSIKQKRKRDIGFDRGRLYQSADG